MYYSNSTQKIIIYFGITILFTLSQNNVFDRPILNWDYIRYTPPSLNLVNGENNQIFIDIPREDRAISLKDSYLELNFNVTHRAGAYA